MTPYPHANDDYENPSIVVSNDGVNWITPQGLKNPVSRTPKDLNAGGHYSDPHLVMHDSTMELWYRYNPALKNSKKQQKANNAINIYYRKTIRDGIRWTGAERMMQSKDGHLSLCIDYENGLYKSWYATYSGLLCYSQSRDAFNWSTSIRCSVPLPVDYQPYHQDIIHSNSGYYLLQTAERKENYTFQLFLFHSKDGIHFTSIRQIYPNSNKELWKNISFFRSTLFLTGDRLNLYISLILPNWNWYVTKTEIPMK